MSAITVTVSEVADAIRIVADNEKELAQVERLLAYAKEAILTHAPVAPPVVANEAAIRLIGYLYDQPQGQAGTAFANAMRNSGAAAILQLYRRTGAGTAGGESTELEQPGNISPYIFRAAPELTEFTLPAPAQSPESGDGYRVVLLDRYEAKPPIVADTDFWTIWDGYIDVEYQSNCILVMDLLTTHEFGTGFEKSFTHRRRYTQNVVQYTRLSIPLNVFNSHSMVSVGESPIPDANGDPVEITGTDLAQPSRITYTLEFTAWTRRTAPPVRQLVGINYLATRRIGTISYQLRQARLASGQGVLPEQLDALEKKIIALDAANDQFQAEIDANASRKIGVADIKSDLATEIEHAEMTGEAAQALAEQNLKSLTAFAQIEHTVTAWADAPHNNIYINSEGYGLVPYRGGFSQLRDVSYYLNSVFRTNTAQTGSILWLLRVPRGTDINLVRIRISNNGTTRTTIPTAQSTYFRKYPTGEDDTYDLYFLADGSSDNPHIIDYSSQADFNASVQLATSTISVRVPPSNIKAGEERQVLTTKNGKSQWVTPTATGGAAFPADPNRNALLGWLDATNVVAWLTQKAALAAVMPALVANKWLKVNAAGDNLEMANAPGGGGYTDTVLITSDTTASLGSMTFGAADRKKIVDFLAKTTYRQIICYFQYVYRIQNTEQRWKAGFSISGDIPTSLEPSSDSVTDAEFSFGGQVSQAGSQRYLYCTIQISDGGDVAEIGFVHNIRYNQLTGGKTRVILRDYG
ncbi:MAG: hypothetical protein OXG53_17965 [Chloroflexi bacterium]|nr:hypothetical protein [Chloroflexota bacterium]